MKKRSIACLLAGCMLSGALIGAAGCGEAYTANINWDVDLSNPIDLKGLYPDTGMTGFGQDHTAEIIEDTTGYHIEYYEVSDGNADNEINNILSTQGEYHFMKLTEAQYHPYLEGGTFLDLTELLEKTESGRKLYELIDLMDYGWDAATYVDSNGESHIYGIPDFGYCVMDDQALVWNTNHLIEVGYVNEDGTARLPETLGEVTDALTKMQEKYGAENSNYHAFGLGGSNSVRINPIMSAFGCPLEFYVDDDGNIQQYVFDESITRYVTYMNGLREAGILSDSWQQSSAEDICAKFATELNSCVYVSYWWVTPLINAVVAQGRLAAAAGVENTYQVAHDELIAWQLRVRGDGTSNSDVQEKAMLQGDDAGVSYYTVIPFYMAENAVYIIDFLAKKLEHFAEFYGGLEGVDWNKVDPPAGAEAYYEDGDYGYQQYENYTDKIIYLRPYSYEFNGQTITGGGYWVQLTQNYIDYIVDNSQYCNGTNSVVANVLFHMRETGFDAWQVAIPMDDTIIRNPMTMMPPMEHWAPISILSRTTALRGLASAIDSSNPASALDITRQSMQQRSVNVNGVRYYYWSDDIVAEMTEWYNNVKLNME